MFYHQGKSGMIFVDLVFLVAYTNFYWEKAMRTLGIN